MKLRLSSRSSFFRVSSVVALLMTAATAFAACSADGDLSFPEDELTPPDAAKADSSTTVIPDSSAPDVDDRKPTTCGDKQLGIGEECDDGNTASNDGCSSTCKIESNGPADTCGGELIALTRQDASTLFTGTVSGTTNGLYNHYTSSCGGGSGADAVYRIEPPMTGRATVRISSSAFASILSVRTGCEDTKTELDCVEGSLGDAGASKDLSFPVYENTPFYLFVDGYGGSGGAFTLDVEVQTAICGNGKGEHPEQCDDGNTVDGDGCSATCTIEDSSTPSACPGMGYRLAASASTPGSIHFAGDTTDLTTSTPNPSGCFNGGTGPNAVYAITPTATGHMELSLLANFPNALLHVRRDCSDAATQADCNGAADALFPLTTTIPVVAEQTIYVFVDSGAASAKGLYTLDATLTAGSCGDGALDGVEECDDGNAVDGDGCSAACAVERDPTTYTCPGKGLVLDATNNHAVKVVGTTAPLKGQTVPGNKYTASASCGAAPSDVVYQFTSDIDGWLTAKVKGSFNASLGIRSYCEEKNPDGGTTPPNVQLACSRLSNGNGQELINLPILKGTPYFVTVDGFAAGQAGAFTLDLSVAPPVCGNGVVEGGETCDDGATDDGDGCSATCILEPPSPYDSCGTAPLTTLEPRANGAYGVTIKSGNTNWTKVVANEHSLSPCSSWWADGWFPFTPPINGVMTARITSATFRSTIGVRTGCTPSGTQLTCDGTNAKGGQEITFAAEQGKTYWIGVAGGVVVSNVPELGRFTLDMNLVPQGCGDTFLNAPEECDDGNLVNGDGCSSTCTIESLSGFDSCPGHAVTLTGNGAEQRKLVATVKTKGLPSNTGSACGGSGPEGILAITSDVDGQLVINTSADYPALLYTRTSCSDPTTEIPKSSCSSGLSTVNIAVKKNTPYYVFVDGQNGSAGVAKLQITVTP